MKIADIARQATVKREAKIVSVKEIRILDISLPDVTFYVKCSKGTYIRQLAHDLGEKIGYGAHLTTLRRTRIGPFGIGDAVPLDRISHENVLRPE